MKRLIKILSVVFLFILSLYWSRGWIFRCLVSYEVTGSRPSYVMHDTTLIHYMEDHATNLQNEEVRALINLSLDLTAEQLYFCSTNTRNQPDQLIKHHRAHCVGYAAFASTMTNALFQKAGVKNWKASPVVGQIYFLGMNVHPWFDTPFFMDHDFVLIENNDTGERILSDPTVSDYLDISFVRESGFADKSD